MLVDSNMLERYRGVPGRRDNLNRTGDVLLLAISSSAVPPNDGAFHWHAALTLFALSTACWMLAARALRQYDAGNGRGFVGDVALTVVMVGAVVAPISLLGWAFPHYVTADHLVRLLAVLLPGALILRVYAVGGSLRKSPPIEDVLVVGVGALGRLTGAEIADGNAGQRLLGHLSFEDETPGPRLRAPLLGTVDDLEATLRRQVLDEVYLASSAPDHSPEVQAAIRTCEKLGVPFALPACSYRLARAKPAAASAVADGYLHFRTVPVKPLELWTKRLFDILASITALVLLAPLILVVAALVKLTSRGPVLFRQERVGLHGRVFHMLKFRSMVEHAEALKAALLEQNEQDGPAFKIKRDPRVTPIGRLIRKYSVDEIPQLVNVIRGDMSIVGPRPPLPSEVARYEAWQYRRLSVRPGLTCVWQVSGRNQISFQEWMLLDMRYIDHWSLAQDFNLIWRTFPVVLTGRGAS
jgi:exopolysaccharide biosynthesis polyprenyl glycosylphosphotransferase